ncbi:MAG: squalene synthase HpnC [Phycisphaeraceae bacterium]
MPSAILQQLETYGPQRCPQLSYEQAHDYTRALAQSHYENFTVVSWMLPRRLRDDFQHVYAFCRWADDLGDETGDPAKSLELLDWWRRELDACYAGAPRHPVFVALARTIAAHDIPRKPFDNLIDAFIQDQRVFRYDTWEQVVDYCTRSADPVGRLVLYMCGYRDEERQRLSDATCTALQLTNFWQDVRRDILERDRVYMPRDIASKHSLDVDTMVAAVRADAACQGNDACKCAALPSVGITALLPVYQATMRQLVQRTWPLFEQGRQLWPLVTRDVRVDIQLFTLGGESILKMIRKQDYNTLAARPSLSKGAKMALLLRAVTGKLLSLTDPRGISPRSSPRGAA